MDNNILEEHGAYIFMAEMGGEWMQLSYIHQLEGMRSPKYTDRGEKLGLNISQ
jgi:hypothetical protein